MFMETCRQKKENKKSSGLALFLDIYSMQMALLLDQSVLFKQCIIAVVILQLVTST